MHLIDLDVAAFDIFDLPPLNEYELYIKNFGRSDTKQVITADTRSKESLRRALNCMVCE